MYNMPNYSYYQSPQSNETSQTYFLERTPSAKITLEKALKICPPTSSSSGAALSNSASGTVIGPSPSQARNPSASESSSGGRKIKSNDDEVKLLKMKTIE